MLGGAAVTLPVVARAQQGERMRRIGTKSMGWSRGELSLVHSRKL
jgi:hypothetical protein